MAGSSTSKETGHLEAKAMGQSSPLTQAHTTTCLPEASCPGNVWPGGGGGQRRAQSQSQARMVIRISRAAYLKIDSSLTSDLPNPNLQDWGWRICIFVRLTRQTVLD